jgi:hypothetical protein
VSEFRAYDGFFIIIIDKQTKVYTAEISVSVLTVLGKPSLHAVVFPRFTPPTVRSRRGRRRSPAHISKTPSGRLSLGLI